MLEEEEEEHEMRYTRTSWSSEERERVGVRWQGGRKGGRRWLALAAREKGGWFLCGRSDSLLRERD